MVVVGTRSIHARVVGLWVHHPRRLRSSLPVQVVSWPVLLLHPIAVVMVLITAVVEATSASASSPISSVIVVS